MTNGKGGTWTRFDAPGTLRPPGPIGRLVRLALGAVALWPVVSILPRARDVIEASSITHPSWWIAVAFALWLFPYVLNIGLTLNFGWWPRLVAAVVLGGSTAGSLFVTGTWWSPLAGVLFLAWMTYTFAHLGISFLISSVLATPGCEMRAIPHLWTVLTGRATKEHYCPGPLDRLDKWEARRADAGAT